MTIAKEVTVGQLFQAAVFVLGFIGFVYTIRAEVENMKLAVAENSQEHGRFVRQEDLQELRQDVREIRNMVFDYVSKAERSSSAGGYVGPKTHPGGVISKPQGYRYPDSSDFRGTESVVRPGTYFAGAAGNQRQGR